jgi:hypothetical protein
MITFNQVAAAARLLSSAEGGEKKETSTDVLVMRFTAPTMKEAMSKALKPLDGYAPPIPYRVSGIRTQEGTAHVDVELRLDVGTNSER